MKNIAIIGATGSIGMQSLEVISKYPDDFHVSAIAGYANKTVLNTLKGRYPQAKTWNESVEKDQLKTLIQDNEIDVVLIAIPGKASTEVCNWAIDAGKDVIIASKEAILREGAVLMEKIQKKGIQFHSIDSEMVAISQLLMKSDPQKIEKMIITCSGGPFLGFTSVQLENVTALDAIKHPRWNMGKKISIESALWLNKGYEIIEAHLLFNLPLKKIGVLVHPESYVHGIAEYSDGTQMHQLNQNDMRIPINVILGSYVEKEVISMPHLSLKNQSLNFLEPESYFQMKGIELVLKAYEKNRLTQLMDCADASITKFLENNMSFLEIYTELEQCIAD